MAAPKAKSDAGASELAKALMADMETSEGRSAARTGSNPHSLVRRRMKSAAGHGGSDAVGQILDAKAAADAPAFKARLKHVAEEVAEAASEGGFLGFGGVKVTDAERASIQEVATALGTR
jgi:hypothetical protein